MKLLEVQILLRRQYKSTNKNSVSRFFKTGKGEYAETDKFLEVNAPELRKLAKLFTDLRQPALRILLNSPYNEERLLALLILGDRFEKSDIENQKQIFEFYLKKRERINNWNLVDASAPGILGRYLLRQSPKFTKSTLGKLSASASLWDRRIAIVSTLAFIREGRFEETLWLSREFLDDDQDLIHKASGWMLREVGKKKAQVLKKFLDREFRKMPRTMLRYAIERLPADQKKFYMS